MKTPEMGPGIPKEQSPEILKQPNVDGKISRIAELRRKLHERIEAEKGKEVKISEEKMYHRLLNIFVELAEKEKLSPEEINKTYMELKGLTPLGTEGYYLNPESRGDLPAVLSQLTRKEDDPESGCGWCGWLPPAEDELGALVYCAQHGSACPECRDTNWNNQDEWQSEDVPIADAIYRGAKPSEALAYALHWASYRGKKISPDNVRYIAEKSKMAFEIEQRRKEMEKREE